MAFLSDKLEEIQQSNKTTKEKAVEIIRTLVESMPSPEIGVENCLNQIKCIDNSYKYFCKQHAEYKPDGFRNLLLKSIADNEDLIRRLKVTLNW